MAVKSYDQYCPVAVGLDLLGDRWTLLLLRDLAWYGPKRFGEFSSHNSGLPPALLTERLRRLEAAGLIESSDSRYRLTSAGDEVRPVIDAVARFGVNRLSSGPVTEGALKYLADRMSAVHSDSLESTSGVTTNLTVDGVAVSLTFDTSGITVGDPDSGQPTLELSSHEFMLLVCDPSITLSDLTDVADPKLDNAVSLLSPAGRK